jgi:hypothetical protein
MRGQLGVPANGVLGNLSIPSTGLRKLPKTRLCRHYVGRFLIARDLPEMRCAPISPSYSGALKASFL